MKHNGKLHIGRVVSNSEDDFITIEITDSLSTITFVQVKVSLEQFSRAITSQFVDCELVLNHLDLVGKKLKPNI